MTPTRSLLFNASPHKLGAPSPGAAAPASPTGRGRTYPLSPWERARVRARSFDIRIRQVVLEEDRVTTTQQTAKVLLGLGQAAGHDQPVDREAGLDEAIGDRLRPLRTDQDYPVAHRGGLTAEGAVLLLLDRPEL